jgi:hypothetical protein
MKGLGRGGAGRRPGPPRHNQSFSDATASDSSRSPRHSVIRGSGRELLRRSEGVDEPVAILKLKNRKPRCGLTIRLLHIHRQKTLLKRDIAKAIANVPYTRSVRAESKQLTGLRRKEAVGVIRAISARHARHREVGDGGMVSCLGASCFGASCLAGSRSGASWWDSPVCSVT